MHKLDIEKFLSEKGDFMQIDYLNRYLKLIPPIEMRKFAYLKLAEIYEKKKMFNDVAKSFRNVAMNSVIFREKIKYFVEEAKAQIKNLDFIEVDKAVKRAFSEANSIQRKEINEEIKAFYKIHAEELERQLKRNQASKTYEKLLKMDLTEEEIFEIKEKLKELYEKLGKVRESKLLEGI